LSERIEKLKAIKSAEVGNITLDANLSIDIVTEIFIRINDAGVKLSQADFTMSKIAIYEKVDGDGYGMFLRKYIDYFCELATTSDNLMKIRNNDILRVVSLIEFDRGKLGDLVALLSGRDFEERDYKKAIERDSFDKLEKGIDKYTNKSNFEHFVQDVLFNLGLKDAGLQISRGCEA